MPKKPKGTWDKLIKAALANMDDVQKAEKKNEKDWKATRIIIDLDPDHSKKTKHEMKVVKVEAYTDGSYDPDVCTPGMC